MVLAVGQTFLGRCLFWLRLGRDPCNATPAQHLHHNTNLMHINRSFSSPSRLPV